MKIDQQMPDASIENRCEYSPRGKRCSKPAAQNSYFCAEHTNEPDIDLEVYKSVSARLRQYANSLWGRANFYLLVQAGLFTVFAGIFASTLNQASRYFIPIDFVVGLLGLSQACLWHIANKVTVKYMKLWRGQMIKIDRVIDKRQHHSEVEEEAISSLTPAEVVQWMCLAFITGWLILLGVLFWLTITQ